VWGTLVSSIHGRQKLNGYRQIADWGDSIRFRIKDRKKRGIELLKILRQERLAFL